MSIGAAPGCTGSFAYGKNDRLAGHEIDYYPLPSYPLSSWYRSLATKRLRREGSRWKHGGEYKAKRKTAEDGGKRRNTDSHGYWPLAEFRSGSIYGMGHFPKFEINQLRVYQPMVSSWIHVASI